jgi:hypothetical protein
LLALPLGLVGLFTEPPLCKACSLFVGTESWGENLPLDGRGRPSSPKRFSPGLSIVGTTRGLCSLSVPARETPTRPSPPQELRSSPSMALQRGGSLQSHRAPRRPLEERPLFQRLRGPSLRARGSMALEQSPLFAKPSRGTRGICLLEQEQQGTNRALLSRSFSLWVCYNSKKRKGRKLIKLPQPVPINIYNYIY